ncbi:hydroxyisourate hydrolase [Streptomyces sp. RFCAC02]|uniref:hydroxyisourate hydrolase n=1 Tax=Streptomyces sp. RFCAC02 TaxID=2499143 RepID=UPI0010203316|nr:hydroxyisourate hydrolase [Streptomyces sp. RFCAC02]
MTSPTPPAASGLAWFDGADEHAVRAALLRVCPSDPWAARLIAARPFPGTGALLAANEAAVAALGDDALAAALATPATGPAITRAGLTAVTAAGLTRLAEGTATVSTHVLDTAAGRPAAGVPVTLAVRHGRGAPFTPHATGGTDADGRCGGLPALPGAADAARLTFAVDTPFFPEAAVTFRVVPGEHFHVPLLLSPYGHSVYRGS